MVTGAAGLLGKHHARALAEIGFDLVLCDINSSALLKVGSELLELFPNTNFETVVLDVTNEDSVRKLVEKIGFINVLVNNAAINEPIDLPLDNSVQNFSIERWNHHLSVGLLGTFLMCKYFGSKMSDGSGGSIINIASDLSVISPDQRLYRNPHSNGSSYIKPVSYSVTKTGILGLTRYLATYWASSGVRVNALSPGSVENSQDPEFISRIISLIPLGRMARPSEYEGAIKFLASDSSSYMTGQNLIIDGGRTIW